MVENFNHLKELNGVMANLNNMAGALVDKVALSDKLSSMFAREGLPCFNITSSPCFLSEIVAIIILTFIILTQLLGKVNLPQVLAYFAEKTFQK